MTRADAGGRHNPFGRYPKRLTKAQTDTMRDLYVNSGWSTLRIAALFGVTWQAVHYHLRKHGVTLRVRNRDPLLLNYRRDARDEMGCIVTLREREGGEFFSMHIPGKRKEALREVAAWCDTHEGDWRVHSYSTPETILGDLNGVRVSTNHAPEARALGAIGRLDLLDREHR